MYLYGYFLINFFIPPRRAEAITWENFVPAVQKRDPVLPGRNTLHVIADVIYEEFITLPGSRQSGTEFHPG